MSQENSENNSAESTNYDISDYLYNYIKQPNPQYSVMLDGEWGSGKTFFIKNEIEEWKSSDNTTIKDDELKLKPIYVSLYGLSSVNQLVQKIKEEISPILYSKQAKVLKNIGLGLLKATAKIDLKTNDENASLNAQFDFLSLLKSNNDSIKGKKILVFDDLERSEIPLNQLFGFVNEFLEHNGCKVIIITDEDKLKKLYPASEKNPSEPTKDAYELEYLDFKEKLVGQTFKIKADYGNIVDYFVQNSSNDQKEFFSENKDDILDIFKNSELHNLRILKKFFTDFDRFISPIDKNYGEYENLNRIKKPSMICLLIMSLESKSGKMKLDELSNYISDTSFGFDFSKNQDLLKKQFKEKYKQSIQKNNLSLLNSFYQESVFLNFLKTSSINYINDELDYNIRLILENKENDYDMLGQLENWLVLENQDFRQISDRLSEKLINKEFDSIKLLVDLHNVFNKLINKEMLFFRNLDNYIIDNVESILSYRKFPEKFDSTLFNADIYDSKESSSIALKINDLIDRHQAKSIKKLKVDIIEKICDGDIEVFKNRIENEPHSVSNLIWSHNIFRDINLKSFTDNFLTLKPKQRADLISYLVNKRYKNKTFSSESENLKEFVNLLQGKVDCYDNIEQFQIEIYIKKLNETITLLEKE